MSAAPDARIADTAIVHPKAVLGPGCQVWHHSQVREGAALGKGCILGKDVYIDTDVTLGDYCKVQNGAQLFHGAALEDGVFIGPGVILTNDRIPRAINPDGSLKDAADWVVGRTRIRRGASVGAAATVVTGVTIGRFAMIAAGAVVTADVPDHALVIGVPARAVGWVCACGARLSAETEGTRWHCDTCDRRYEQAEGAMAEVAADDRPTGPEAAVSPAPAQGSPTGERS